MTKYKDKWNAEMDKWDYDWDAALTQLEAEAAEEDRYQQELERQRRVTVEEVLAALAQDTQDTGDRRPTK